LRKNTVFFRQAELLLRVLPLVNQEEVFALKGGTAINFFLRDLPRLSVDIDLTYLLVNDRTTALTEIDKTLLRISKRVEKTILGVHVFSKKNRELNLVAGLLIRRDDATIKVEPNSVLRGSVFPTETRTLCQKAQDLFELSIEARTLSFEDLYGGKACAALDRQHPRDLFDIDTLFKNEGFPEKVRKAFIVYLISHSRPMIEILNPNWGDLRPVFEKEFQGMVVEPVTAEELRSAGEQLVSRLHGEMTQEEREFIVSVKEGKPEWNLLGVPGIENLPGVQWKLQNIRRMTPAKHREALQKLRDYLMGSLGSDSKIEIRRHP
jgi:predicted nucleotidyltransferase component of viral defense system